MSGGYDKTTRWNLFARPKWWLPNPVSVTIWNSWVSVWRNKVDDSRKMGENALNNPGTRIAYINTNFGRHPTVPIFNAGLKTASLNLLVRRLNPVCSQNCKQVFFWYSGSGLASCVKARTELFRFGTASFLF